MSAPDRKVQLTIRLPAVRSQVLLLLLLAGFVILVARDLYLQGWRQQFLQQKGNARIRRVIELTAHRGMITDRTGEPVAVSAPVSTVAASPADVKLKPGQLEQLARLLGMPPAGLQKRLANQSRDFVFLKRQLPPDIAAQIAQMDIPGIFFQKEYKRFYPEGEVMSHVIGFTNINDRGQEGVELADQKWLAGVPGSERVLRDNKGHIIDDLQTLRKPVQGHDLQLSIDHRIQYLAYRELAKAVDYFQAKSGSAIVLDAKTGEVLALANVPSYNPNNREHLVPGSTRNRALTDTYEPGSTMKPFTISAVMETGKYTPSTVVVDASQPLVVSGRTIHEAEKLGVLTLAQVLQKSSNRGTAKLSLTMPPQYMWNYYHKAGFGQKPGLGFPGEVSGRLRPWQNWRPIDQATIAFGQGISVSLMQMARAYTIFANDGKLLPTTLFKRNGPPDGVQVFSPKTADTMRVMLEAVTQDGGTAPTAAIRGYKVGGKTGTAQVEENGHYAQGKYVGSFVGFAPASNPRLICAVMINQPSKNGHFGGVVAGPVFSRVMSGALNLLNIQPDWPEQLTEPVGHIVNRIDGLPGIPVVAPPASQSAAKPATEVSHD
jgi:cell division protein FtsI (penicillin-binding protein 3)